MLLVKDLVEVIKSLGEVVKSTREIIEAVNDGRKYLALKHPEASEDFDELIGQMMTTIEGLSKVTTVISHFRFTTDGKNVDSESAYRELARFNDYIMKQNEEITALEKNVRKMKSDCDKIRDLRDKLDRKTGEQSWGSLFGLLGTKSRDRSQELHKIISNFYADDQIMYNLIQDTLLVAKKASEDVLEVVGPSGHSNPYNINSAAEMLGIYSVLFSGPSKELKALADEMSEVRSRLIVERPRNKVEDRRH